MNFVSLSSLRATLMTFCGFAVFAPMAFAGSVTITSPRPSATVSGAVSIAAYANEGVPMHLEVWDNGQKLGDFFSTSMNTSRSMAQGKHTTTVLAVANTGGLLNQNTVVYNVAAQGANGNGSGSGITINSPKPGENSINAVAISASANVGTSVHLEIWDNGTKLGSIPGGSVNGVYVLPNGSHVLTVNAISNSNGALVTSSNVNYDVSENCSNSRWAQCNLDQIAINNVQNDCNPPEQTAWVANPCGPGVQGRNPVNPKSTQLQPVYEGSTPSNQNNLSLNGRALHVGEQQGSNPSNVLFRGQSPSETGNAIDSHWMLDAYVHLPDPTAHQALEMDAQYTAGGIWTKFYTECAFNMNNGNGFWAVFDTSTGGWIFLNGQTQNGQATPYVPCNRSQFYQPWSGSSNPGFTGWHHVQWSFYRNGDGTVTFQSITFDGKTTQLNFHPNSQSGGRVNDNGKFSALIQLDGVVNNNWQHNEVDAYVSQVNLFHTP